MSLGNEGCRDIYWGFTGAVGEVSSAISFAQNIASSATRNASDAASSLLDFSFDPVHIPQFNYGEVTYPGYNAPLRPEAGQIDEVDESGQPVKPGMVSVDLSALTLTPPTYDIDTPDIQVPASPNLVAPSKPGAAPTFQKVSMPEYDKGDMPVVPTLEELQIPEAPVLDLESFDVDRPEFDLPHEHIYHNSLIEDTKELASEYLGEYLQFDPDGEDVRERWRGMLQGGTGLPAAIEQALFDRAIGREEVSSEQATKQAQGEWAARGFSLPGSTLLAREGEIRRANRTERGRINRELTIQLHQQEIENLRFTVEQGVRLEGQRFDQYVRIRDAARAVVTSSYEAARSILSARIEILNAQLQIYQTDVQVFRERVQIELARLEVFRTQLEAERVRGEINQQRVQIYEAQLRGLLANVEVYKAEIEGANGLVRAQIGEMELYKTRIDAYRTEWDAQRVQTELYTARVSAEETKSRIFESQVRAFGERVNAFGQTVNAGRAKVEGQTNYNTSVTQQYSEDVRAWQAKISARVEKIRAQVSEFEANVGMYRADIAGEQVRGDGFRSNASLAIEQNRAGLEGKLKQIDQQIEQLRLAESLGLQATQGAAQTYAQLAASSLSAINASASISDSVSKSNSGSSSCSESYVLSGEI